MNTTKKHTETALIKPSRVRGLYVSPHLERITLDKEISLALQSTDVPPDGPYESSVSPQYQKTDPFNNLA